MGQFISLDVDKGAGQPGEGEAKGERAPSPAHPHHQTILHHSAYSGPGVTGASVPDVSGAELQPKSSKGLGIVPPPHPLFSFSISLPPSAHSHHHPSLFFTIAPTQEQAYRM